MTRHKITLVPGDGIGPEVTGAAISVMRAAGVQFEWESFVVGAEALSRFGDPLPQDLFESIKRTKVALKGPVMTPIGTGFVSANVRLRKALDLYANLRPIKTLKGVKSRYENVDLIVVRENTEDLYAGIEFERGSHGAGALRHLIHLEAKRDIPEDSGISIKPISVAASERIVRYAFDYAKKNGRRKVTAVHKANIMKFSDGLFLEVARRTSKEYSGVAFEDRIVDNMCMQLVQTPENYDVLVMPNLYGDILSDLAAGLIGGLGVAPGANIGEDAALFEPTHGSAPRYAGQDKVNPLAMILSGMLMLRHLGEDDAAGRLERAVARVIREGKSVTYDMKTARDDPSAVGTQATADAVIALLR